MRLGWTGRKEEDEASAETVREEGAVGGGRADVLRLSEEDSGSSPCMAPYTSAWCSCFVGSKKPASAGS